MQSVMLFLISLLILSRSSEVNSQQANTTPRIEWHDYTTTYVGYTAVCSLVLTPMSNQFLPVVPRTMTIQLEVHDSILPDVHEISYDINEDVDQCISSKTVKTYAYKQSRSVTLHSSSFGGGTCAFNSFTSASRDITLISKRISFHDLGVITCTATYDNGTKLSGVFESPFYRSNYINRRLFTPSIGPSLVPHFENGEVTVDVECSLTNHRRYFNAWNVANRMHPYYLQSLKILDSQQNVRAYATGDILRRQIGANRTEILPLNSTECSASSTCYFPLGAKSQPITVDNIINTQEQCFDNTIIVNFNSCENNCSLLESHPNFYEERLFSINRQRGENDPMVVAEINIDVQHVFLSLLGIYDLEPIPLHNEVSNVTVVNMVTAQLNRLYNYIPYLRLSKNTYKDLYAKIFSRMHLYSKIQVKEIQHVVYSISDEETGDLIARRRVGEISCGENEGGVALIIMSGSCAISNTSEAANNNFDDSLNTWCSLPNGHFTVVELNTTENNQAIIYKKIGITQEAERDAHMSCVVNRFYCLSGHRSKSLSDVTLLNSPTPTSEQTDLLQELYNDDGVFNEGECPFGEEFEVPREGYSLFNPNQRYPAPSLSEYNSYITDELYNVRSPVTLIGPIDTRDINHICPCNELLSICYTEDHGITGTVAINISALHHDDQIVCEYFDFSTEISASLLVENNVCPNIPIEHSNLYMSKIIDFLPSPFMDVHDRSIILNGNRFYLVSCSDLRYECVALDANNQKNIKIYADDQHEVILNLVNNVISLYVKANDTLIDMSLTTNRDKIFNVSTLYNGNKLHASLLVESNYLSTQQQLTCLYDELVTSKLNTSSIECLTDEYDIVIEKYTNETHNSATCRFEFDRSASSACQPNFLQIYINGYIYRECSLLDDMQEVTSESFCFHDDHSTYVQVIETKDILNTASTVECIMGNLDSDFSVSFENELSRAFSVPCQGNMELLNTVVRERTSGNVDIRCFVEHHCENDLRALKQIGVEFMLSHQGTTDIIEIATRGINGGCTLNDRSNYVNCNTDNDPLSVHVRSGYFDQYMNLTGEVEIKARCVSWNFFSIQNAHTIFRAVRADLNGNGDSDADTARGESSNSYNSADHVNTGDISHDNINEDSVDSPGDSISSTTVDTDIRVTSHKSTLAPTLSTTMRKNIIKSTTTNSMINDQKKSTTTKITTDKDTKNKKKKSNFVDLVVSIVAGVIALLLILASLYLVYRRKRMYGDNLKTMEMKTFLKT